MTCSHKTRKTLGFENLETRRLMAADIDLGSGYTNPDNPFDVDGSGTVSADDVQAIVAVLNRGGPRALADRSETGDVQTPFVDANADGLVTPLDILMVARELNTLEGEGDAPLAGPDRQTCPENPLDVDGSGSVTVDDAQAIIDDLNQFGPRQFPTDGKDCHPMDVNRDGVVSPLDVLAVMEELGKGDDGEGETDNGPDEMPPGQTTPPVDLMLYGSEPSAPQDPNSLLIDDTQASHVEPGDLGEAVPRELHSIEAPEPPEILPVTEFFSDDEGIPELSEPTDLESSIADIASDISSVWTSVA